MLKTYRYNLKENSVFKILGFQRNHSYQERNKQNLIYQHRYYNRLLESFGALLKHLLYADFLESTNKPKQICFSPEDRVNPEEPILSVCVSVYSRFRTEDEKKKLISKWFSVLHEPC